MPVIVAILDAAISLNHPDLTPYNKLGRKWNVSALRFDPTKPGIGNDDVAGPNSNQRSHGAAILGILHQKISGLSTPVEVHLIRLAADDGTISRISIVKGLELALKLKADIATLSVVAEADATTDLSREEKLLKKITADKMLVCTTLVNSNIFEKFNLVKFPAAVFSQFVCGVLTKKLLAQWKAGSVFSSKIQILAPEADFPVIDSETTTGVRQDKLKSSHLTAWTAGLLAEGIDGWMAAEKEKYKRRTWKQAMKLLNPQPFDPAVAAAAPFGQLFQPGISDV